MSEKSPPKLAGYGLGVETVRWCVTCKCETWHVDEVCEWSDGHDRKQPLPSFDWSKIKS